MKNMGIKIKQLVVISLAILLAACGSTPQPTVALSSNILTTKDLKLGYVYVGPEGQATTHIFGASCLLC
ncbi:MAG: starvation-inducible outer membrane lipoprotein [Congregibacter sp.]|jgi:starvation-inducible outer membrane lipoprotein